jgi:DNA polymerase-3 subunit alpha
MGINVMNPDVNESFNVFTADKKGNVRYGMAAIKGVGDGAVSEIVAERERGGRFTDIYNFVERVNLSAVNRKVIDCLAMAGAFDEIIDFPRDKFFVKRGDLTFSEELVRYGNRHREERENSQRSLFDMFDDDAAGVARPTVPDYNDPALEQWGKLQTLSNEKTAIGMYLSSHPLEDYSFIIEQMCNVVPEQLNNLPELKGSDVAFAGIVTSVQVMRNKSDKEYCRFKLEGYDGTSCEIMLFNKDFENFRKFIYVNYFLLIRGKVAAPKYSPDRIMLQVNSIQKLEDVAREAIKKITIAIPAKGVDKEFIESFSKIVDENKGTVVLCVNVYSGGVAQRFVSRTKRVRLSRELIRFLEENELSYTLS